MFEGIMLFFSKKYFRNIILIISTVIAGFQFFHDKSSKWFIAYIIVVLFLLFYTYKINKIERSDAKMFIDSDSDSDLIKRINCAEKIPLQKLMQDPNIKCRFLDTKDKKHKFIIQIGFIITDVDRNILVISRKGKYHSIKKHTNSILVSFSPIPDRYNEIFDIKEIYYREIPRPKNIDLEPEIKELEYVISRNMDLQISYCFYLFEANYSHIDFTNGNNKDLLFKSNDGLFFVKDRDSICKIASIEEVNHMIQDEHIKGTAEIEAFNRISR